MSLSPHLKWLLCAAPDGVVSIRLVTTLVWQLFVITFHLVHCRIVVSQSSPITIKLEVVNMLVSLLMDTELLQLAMIQQLLVGSGGIGLCYYFH